MSSEDVANSVGPRPVDTSAGHLSLHFEEAHPPELQFLFAQQPKRMFGSVSVSVAVNVMAFLLIFFISRLPARQTAAAPQPSVDFPMDQIVWLDQKGPGGGGGGGGNHSPDPPQPAQLKGKEKITVPVAPPVPLEVPKPKQNEPEPPVQQVNIPAQTLASALQEMPGTIAAVPSAVASGSLGSGGGGGAGTGQGTGIGPGTGSGLGPGSGGGTGGGFYQPGNGVTSPVPINPIPKPKYTAEAMRARIQGTARVVCVVQPSGVCTNIEIVHSLDPTFGLDVEAINSVKLWRFKPGMRFGQPVPVQVTIDVEFALR